MNVKIHILKATRRLTPFANDINKEVRSSIKKIKKKLPISDVDLVFYDHPERTIKGFGIGGYTANAHTIFIYLDPAFKNFKKVIKEEIPRALAHEFHHVARWRGPGFGNKLLETLVTEGLADHFDIEIFNKSPRPWCKALSKKETKKLLKMAEKEFYDDNHDHFRWFFGRGDKNIPRWTGYTLGFEIIGRYLRENPDKKPSTLFAEKADVFIKRKQSQLLKKEVGGRR